MLPQNPPPEKAKRAVEKESIRNSTVSGRMPSVEIAEGRMPSGVITENASDKIKMLTLSWFDYIISYMRSYYDLSGTEKEVTR